MRQFHIIIIFLPIGNGHYSDTKSGGNSVWPEIILFLSEHLQREIANYFNTSNAILIIVMLLCFQIRQL